MARAPNSEVPATRIFAWVLGHPAGQESLLTVRAADVESVARGKRCTQFRMPLAKEPSGPMTSACE